MPDEFMTAAIAEAEAGAREGGIPIGAVLVHGGRIIGRGTTGACNGEGRPCTPRWMHWRTPTPAPGCLSHERLYTTLSPCAMCSGAVLLYGIPKVIAGRTRRLSARSSCFARVASPSKCFRIRRAST